MERLKCGSKEEWNPRLGLQNGMALLGFRRFAFVGYRSDAAVTDSRASGGDRSNAALSKITKYGLSN